MLYKNFIQIKSQVNNLSSFYRRTWTMLWWRL